MCDAHVYFTLKVPYSSLNLLLQSNQQYLFGSVENATHLIIFCNGVLLAPADLVISAHTSSATGATQSCKSF